jgi:O-succinylhomoserine sulfhydrylase
LRERKLATRAVRVGQYPKLSDSHCEPIAMASACTFASAEAQSSGGAFPGRVYSRFFKPAVQAFEQRIASREPL